MDEVIVDDRETSAGSRAVMGLDADWWRGAVIYQIYPRSFCDSTGNGVGDLNGITSKLDHVASLGVDGIWISPFFTSPMKDYGYDVSDYCDVDPVFGTLSDFDRLIARAEALGLKVIIDQVYSHTSDAHPWFEDSRSSRTAEKADWYVWADPKPDGSPPSNWQSVFGGPAWEWDARRQQYYLHNFLKEQPQLNAHNPDVQDALINVARFWLDRGVHGFRLDAINFCMHDTRLRDNPPSGVPAEAITRPFDMQQHVYNQSHPNITGFLERIRAVLDSYGERFAVAEIGGPDPLSEMYAFTQGDRRLHSAYSFDFLYADALTPERIQTSLGAWRGKDGEGWPSWAFSNHDTPRAVSRWTGAASDTQIVRTCLLALLSLRGNAFLYQGEELGLPQADVPFDRLLDPEAIANWPRTLGRDGARTPMPWSSVQPHLGFSTGEPWLPVDPRHGPLAVEQQEAVATSTLALTRQLLDLRRGTPALRTGDLEFLCAPEGALLFTRSEGGQTVFCAFNFSGTAIDLPLPEGLRLLASDKGIGNGGPVSSRLEPWESIWAELPTAAQD